MTNELQAANGPIDVATRLLESGDFKKGGEIFQRVLQSDSNNRDAMFGLGVCCHLLGNVDEANRLIEEAAKLGSKEANSYLGRSQTVQQREQANRIKPFHYMLIASGVIVLIVFALNFWRTKIFWEVIGGFFGAAIGSFLGALILQYATKFVAKFKPAYWNACKACFISFMSTCAVGFVIGFIIGLTRNKYDGAVIILNIVIGYFIQVVAYMKFLKYPDETDLSFKTSCYISLLQMVIGGVALIAVSLVIFMIVMQQKS